MPAYRWLGPLRERARRTFLTLLRQALQTEDGRRIVADAMIGVGRDECAAVPSSAAGQPYADLGAPAPQSAPRRPIFITGRFRSGSTILWNIFRHVDGCTSYYEPLNERQWFNPAIRGDRVDPSHLGVTDYWREYAGLDHLGRWYQPHWIDRNLYMRPHFWDPNLFAYIQALVEAAPGRAVLQFNRVDFRLPWLAQQFPDARLIHIYRHPRDQWCSALLDPSRFPPDGRMIDYARHDHFYLLAWAKDLSYNFPFLDPRAAEHPYDTFYMIWRLSYLFGRQYCHASFCFETLCANPALELARLMAVCDVDTFDIAELSSLIVPQKPGRWVSYAAQAWFAEREAKCDEIMARFAWRGTLTD